MELFERSPGRYVSLTADARFIEVETTAGLSVSCSELEREEFVVEPASETYEIRRVLELEKMPTVDRWAMLVDSGRGVFVLEATSFDSLRTGEFIAVDGAYPSVVYLSAHPRDPQRILLRFSDDALLTRSIFVGSGADLGSAARIELFSSYRELLDGIEPKRWPDGVFDVFTSSTGFVVDTRVGLEWLSSDGEVEQLWGAKNTSSVRGGAVILTGGEQLLMVHEGDAPDARRVAIALESIGGRFTVSSSVSVELQSTRLVVAEGPGRGVVQSLRVESPERLLADRVQVGSGVTETIEVDLSATSARAGFVFEQSYLGDGVWAAIIEAVDGRGVLDPSSRSVLLFGDDFGAHALRDSSAVRRFIPSQHGARRDWVDADGRPARIEFWRNGAGELDARLVVIPMEAFSSERQTEPASIVAASPICAGAVHVVAEGESAYRLENAGGWRAADITTLPLSRPRGVTGVDAARSPAVHFNQDSRGIAEPGSAEPASELPIRDAQFRRLPDGRLVVFRAMGDVFVEQR